MKALPWTPEEDAKLCEHTLAGKTYEEVVALLPGRTYAGVKCRLRYVNLSTEDRAEANRKKRARRVVPPRYQKRAASKDDAVPPEVIADAIRRATAPRSVTAWICGDPAPGQSALERRA
jgi:hypothetical protein